MYTGTLVKDLMTTVEQVLIESRDSLYQRVDEALAASRLYRDAFAIHLLDESMTHLTDARRGSRYPAFDEGDLAAWEHMEVIRDYLLYGSRCLHCGQTEGSHTALGGFCATRGVTIFRRFSPERIDF